MSPLFRFLTEQELEIIDRNKNTSRFKKGETIRKQGTVMTHVLSVNAGVAKVFLEGPNSKNIIIRIIKQTNFIGGPGIYLDKVHHYSIKAMTDVRVCFIDMEVFKHILDTNKPFANEFLKDFSNSILSVYNRLLSLLQKQTLGRLAETLLYLAEEIFEVQIIPSCVSRLDLAELSGISKESVSIAIRQFEKDHIIAVDKSGIEILNPAKLSYISRTS